MFIYGLFDPITQELRYIGKAINPKNRFNGHLKDNRLTHKGSWIKSLLKNNLKPEMVVLEEVSDDNWQQEEHWWISYMKSLGVRLTNLNEGGQGGIRPSEETRIKMGRGRLGKSPYNKGIPWDDETKRKISLSLMGRKNKPHSEETKLKMSLSQKGIPETENARQINSESHKGLHHSSESKKKISESNKGKHLYWLGKHRPDKRKGKRKVNEENYGCM